MNKYKVYRHGEKEPFIVIGVYPTMERGKLVLFDSSPGFDENGNPTRVISAANKRDRSLPKINESDAVIYHYLFESACGLKRVEFNSRQMEEIKPNKDGFILYQGVEFKFIKQLLVSTTSNCYI